MSYQKAYRPSSKAISKAKEKLEMALSSAGLYYIDESENTLLRNNIVNRHLGLETYRFFINSEAFDPSPIINAQVILSVQDSRERHKKPEENPKGYLKLDLRKFSLVVPRWSGAMNIVAFYIEDEDKLFFKNANIIHAYAEAISRNKSRKTATGTVVSNGLQLQGGLHYMKFTPDMESRLGSEYVNPERMPETTMHNEISYGGRSIKTEEPFVFNEEEFIRMVGQFTEYPDIFKLKFKTIKRIMER